MKNTAWTDEQLSGFLDGELATAEMDALARDLESDDDLAARVERLSVANTAFLAFAARIDDVPVSANLKAAMETTPGAKVVKFRQRQLGVFLFEHRAIAASLLCVAAVWGLMSTMTASGPPDPLAPGPDGMIVAGSPLSHMLEASRTGEGIAIGDDAMATARLTFTSADGAFCRQFDLVKGDSASAAIACREEKGWRTQVVAYGLARAPGDFQTASAERSPALEAFLDQRISGAPMNAEEEARLLSDRWAVTGR